MSTDPVYADARAVLDFWFGAPGSATDGKPRVEWFRKSDAFDDGLEAAALGDVFDCGQVFHGDGFRRNGVISTERVVSLRYTVPS